MMNFQRMFFQNSGFLMFFCFTFFCCSMALTAGDKPLAGIKICIDPGHGGNESGAVGKEGTKEKDINLKVALMLRDMLKADGAEIVMTREDNSSISITARHKFNKAENTDLFISVHHNANAQGDDEMNRIESFWHWKDDGGPSEDLARLVLREMQATSGRPGKAYMCWAYGVLRENSYPAVLAEYSYLQNPDEEKRLNDDAYLRGEAEAYHKAIVNFFKDGRPEVTIDGPDIINTQQITGSIISREGDSLVDPQSIVVTLDGERIKHARYEPQTGKIYITLNYDTSPSTHTLHVSARNLAGRYSNIAVKKVKVPKVSPYSTIAQYAPVNLSGKTIVLDPAGGGDDAVAIGPNGLRASDANLMTAEYLADYLRLSGAEVIMTRERDEARDNVARVRIGLETDPDLFLTIGYRMPEPGMGEMPGENMTRIGSRWSDGKAIGTSMIFHVREAMGTGTGEDDVTTRAALKGEIHNWSSWEAMHGAQNYTAHHVSPLMFDAPGAAERLSTPAGNRKAALGILYGLADYFGANETKMGRVDGVVLDDTSGAPIANALVWVDNSFLVETEDDGCFTLKYLNLDHSYSILTQARGYASKVQHIDIKSADPAKMEIRLKAEK